MNNGQRKYDIQNLANIEEYSKKVRTLYNDIIYSIARLSSGCRLDANNQFFWRNNPIINKKVNKLIKELNKGITGFVVSGINSEWNLANDKHDALAAYVCGKRMRDIPANIRNRWFTANEGARQAFINRKVGGLSISKKVWNLTSQFKSELELALEQGIISGVSASTLANQISGYLTDPDMLFRRVADESGILRLSKNAKAYTPGRGRYRSSYKNALRLTRNEINFAYETAQMFRRRQQDWIVGVRIKVSENHNPKHDTGGIPCILLQGDYPKNFDFSMKWHVNCKCESYNILKDRKELDEDLDLIVSGKQPTTSSKNEVTKLPKQFTDFVTENTDLWANWKRKPNFLKNMK